VRQDHGQGHVLGGLIRRVPEHDALEVTNILLKILFNERSSDLNS
jgi:hypothetical protein